MPDDAALEISFANQRPVELIDLAESFIALGRQYEEFVYSRGYDPQARNVRLYIVEIRSGSIIARLQEFAEQTSFILKHADVYAAFVTSLNEIVQYLLGT